MSFDSQTTVSTATIASQTVATTSYVLTDGILGDDTAQDGTIIDPVGPATSSAQDSDGDGYTHAEEWRF